MQSELLIFAGAAVLATSFLSGVIGGGGGTLLLGILLLGVDVPTAMVIFGCAMIVGVLGRLAVWRRHIAWAIVGRFIPGVLVTLAAMWFVAMVPPAWLLFLSLGMLPFISKHVPTFSFIDITNPRGAFVCSSLVTIVQMLAGASGILLDRLFLSTTLDRKTIVATKSALLVLMHLTRIGYFGSLASASVGSYDLAVFAVIAVLGTLLAVPVLSFISERTFRNASEAVISGVSMYFIARGAWLLF